MKFYNSLIVLVIFTLMITPVSMAQLRHDDIYLNNDAGESYRLNQEADSIVLHTFSASGLDHEKSLKIPAGYRVIDAAWAKDLVVALTDGRNISICKFAGSSFVEITRLTGQFENDAVRVSLSDDDLFVVGKSRDTLALLAIDIAHSTITKKRIIPVDSEVRSLDILFDRKLSLAWETRTSEQTVLHTLVCDDSLAGLIKSVTVNPYDSNLDVQLVSEKGRPAVVWQGVANEQSRLFMQDLDSDSPQILVLHVPDNAGGILSPRRAVGDSSRLSAYAFSQDRWAGYEGKLDGGRISGDLIYSSKGDIREPRIIVTGDKDIWIAEDVFEPGSMIILPSKSLSKEKPRLKPEATDGDSETIHVLAFGDSITASQLYRPETNDYINYTNGYYGYLPHFEELYEKYFGNVQIDQSGSPGEKTPAGMIRLQSVLNAKPVGYYDYVLLLEGTNDYFNSGGPDITGVTIPNLRQMAFMVRQKISIPVMGTMLPRKYSTDPRSDRHAFELNKKIIPMAQNQGIILAYFEEFFPLDREYLNDQNGRMLHPTRKGYELMAHIWLDAVLPLFADINRDGQVNETDLSILTTYWGERTGSNLFYPDVDYDQNGIINANDFIRIFKRMGKELIPEDEVLRNQ